MDWKVNDLLMSCDVEKEVRELGCRIFGSMGSGVAHNHEDGLVGLPLLWLPKEGQRVVRDQVGEVVFSIVEPVFDLQWNKKAFIEVLKFSSDVD